MVPLVIERCLPLDTALGKKVESALSSACASVPTYHKHKIGGNGLCIFVPCMMLAGLLYGPSASQPHPADDPRGGSS